jgi:hypothetical protein
MIHQVSLETFSGKRFFLEIKCHYICTAIKQNGEVALLVRASRFGIGKVGNRRDTSYRLKLQI